MRSTARSIAHSTMTAAVVLAVSAGLVAAQQPDPQAGPAPPSVEVDPITCWWRTSAGAVRAGEPFAIVLTCAVVESALTTVVPDQSQIEPAALQLPPFDMLGGTRFAERRDAGHRFFQYEYRVRLIQENAFGSDVALPPLAIKYRIRTRTADGSSVDGREQMYLLPPLSVRVLSLVAADASDIRDATSGTFADVDAQSFRADLLRLAGVVLFSLAAILALQTGVRLTKNSLGRDDPTRQLLPPALVLRRAARELRAVQRQRAHEGWSDALVGRALWALRIVGAYALARRTGQAVAPATNRDPQSRDGHLVVEGGWRRDTDILVSGAVTAATLGRALADVAPASRQRLDLEDLQAALAQFAAVQYGRADPATPARSLAAGGVDEAALDDSLERGRALARRLAMRQFWPVKKFRGLTDRATTLGRRVWSR
jgi:hypothetical protein